MRVHADFNRWVAGMVVGLGSTLVAFGQTPSLPASAPTGAQHAVSELPSAQPARTVQTSHLAVLWDGVELQVNATNVPLSRVLREISAKTKLHITGGVPDERIFGSYGPGPMNLVVPALLDGLPVNVLLTERSGGAPNELQLTARNGMPTSPNIPTQQDADEAANAGQDIPAAQGTPGSGARQAFNQPNRQPGPRVTGQGNAPIAGNTLGDNGLSGSDNGINGPNNGLNGADNGISVAPSGTDVNATGTASPNGVRTPQEIFEQLQRLRQQQGQPQ